mmetsp:Transcript_5835/g.16555  ORF Transcript_5835/g.16555 Transcript_5835/m.16555 type:complete len:105 (+) Transcript_5835:1602-1916(+)
MRSVTSGRSTPVGVRRTPTFPSLTTPPPPPPSYQLVSVVVHHGEEAHVGHFSAFVRRGHDKWISCDDRMISEKRECEVLNHAGALLLTYVDTTRTVVDVAPTPI